MWNGEVIDSILTLALTAAGVMIAWQQWKQTQIAQEAEARQREAEDRRFALELLEPLASAEIHEVLNTKPPRNVSLVEAVFELCTVKVTQLLPQPVRDELAPTITKAMEPAKEFLAVHGGPGYSESVERLEAAPEPKGSTRPSGADHTKYFWDGGPRKHTKIWTINLIAQKWAADHGITTREAFEESFLAEARKAVGDRELEAGRLLRDTTSADEKTNYVPELLLRLDGKEYGVTWLAGATNAAQIGVEVHKPIVEWFRKEHGYPAEPA